MKFTSHRPWHTCVCRTIGLMVLAGLAACTSWHPPPVAASMPEATAASVAQAERWSGYLSLKRQAFGDKGSEGGSFHFDLQGHAWAGVLDISTPLGTLVASVRWGPQGASLLTPDGQQVFASVDALLTQTVGEPLPIATLMQWLKGLPDPTLPVIWPATTGNPTPASLFQQAGWWVNTTELALGGVLQAHRDPQPLVRGARLTIRLDQ